MKIITVILIIFCAYLHAKDSIEIKSPDILKDAVSSIGDTVSDAVHKVVPDCIFGVESVSVVLYTRDIPFGKNIGVDEVCDDFDQSKPIVFLVHGFISNANYINSYRLSEELVKKDVTVFSLDWSDATCTTGLPVAKFVEYPSAVKNTREIGVHLARYVKSVIDKCGVPLDNMTFIGHSLGAHVSAFASRDIQKSGYGVVPLLFGVEPAEPLFVFNNCEYKLCNSDADRVIALHTSLLGIISPIGDVNLYFNGGVVQPGCNVLDVECSHSSAVLYLAIIVNNPNCGFPAIPMSFMAIKSPISRKPYPRSNTTDCFVMNHTIFNKNREFDKLKKKNLFYVFVESDTFCTEEKFGCEY